MLRIVGGLVAGLLLLFRLQADTPPGKDADPSTPQQPRVKSAVELAVERLIDAAYASYFKLYTIGGAAMTVRVPFGLPGEREGTPGYVQQFALEGKGTPEELWPLIDAAIASPGFRDYAARLLQPTEQAVFFDLEKRTVTVSTDPRELRLLEEGPYPGTETRIYLLRFGGRVTEEDVYNYLYAVVGIGVDCTGFVYQIQRSVALGFGGNLDRDLGRLWRLRPDKVAQFTGLSFYDPAGRYTEEGSEVIEDLRPGDVILFRGGDGAFKHSAVIQSIDLAAGRLRYLQSTDWAPQAERGVHDSIIRFDPANPRVTLRDPSVQWLQQVRPPFRGEVEPRDWRNDRHRYLYAPAPKGSVVVRLRLLEALLRRAEPRYYENVRPQEGRPPQAGGSGPSGGRGTAGPATSS